MHFEANNISFKFKKDAWLLKNVSLSVDSGECVGLVGPSGYGKSTLAKILSGYYKPMEGQVLFNDKPLPKKGYSPIQLIYQHPEKAVNPRWKMKDILNEGWLPDKSFYQAIGIEEDHLRRWPRELSGGELQRFCVARALGPQTKMLIADEISTMLDAITQAQVWQFILNTAKQNHMGILMITHNHALAKKVCTRIVNLQDINHM